MCYLLVVHKLEDFILNYPSYGNLADVRLHSHVEYKNKKYPLVSIHYGNPTAPTLLLTGGVHGLERIGAQLTLSLLNSFHQRLSWDSVLQEMLKKVQVVFIPLVNPYGYFEIIRGNGNGVDLMRNAPVEAEEKVHFLLGGHNYTNKIHWYRGEKVEQENQFVFDVVKDILSKSDCLISVDAHSGFGLRDQLWFPFANSRKTFSQINEMYLLFELFEQTHPYHVYKIEPQSKNYLTHGDVWDYCFLNLRKEHQIYMPLTLEMGSWIWVKKNPWQIFSKTGLFNPIKEHRLNRTLRRHRPLFEFLIHSLISNSLWTAPQNTQSFLVNERSRMKYYVTK
jgi:hypothetical protein